jgi:hypothetical protein
LPAWCSFSRSLSCTAASTSLPENRCTPASGWWGEKVGGSAALPARDAAHGAGLGQRSAARSQNRSFERPSRDGRPGSRRAQRGRFENPEKAEFQEVSALWNRAVDAAKKLQQAQKLSQQDGHAAEAAALVHAAAAEYPHPQMSLLVDAFDGGVAFEKKDYDAFLSLTERDWAEQPSSITASGLASALDCKYAVTGDPQYRQRSEQLMAKPREMAQGDKEVLANLNEYEDRHKYRLETRQIIAKNEYDRRFRKAVELAKQE